MNSTPFSPLSSLLFFFITATASLLMTVPAQADQQTVKAEVIKVIDGLTLFVKSTESGKEYTVTLYGVDTQPMPESQYETPPPFAQKTKDMTEKLVGMSKAITVTKLDDRYNPTVGVVHFPELNITLQHQLLNSGLVWVDKKACKNYSICRRFRNLQDNAKMYGHGIWSAVPPVAPED